jgi:hypothetical protein
MKPFAATVFLFYFLLLQSGAVPAQGVYMTRGEKGPIFSDKPAPGAREVTLQPLTVVAPPKESGPTASATSSAAINDSQKPETAAATYRSFSVVSPENGGSVAANTAFFEVRVAVDPALQLGERHAFAGSINGRPVNQRFTATEFTIPPEFWGDALAQAGQSMQLDASIVDGSGQGLKKTAPVRFYLRYVTILNNPNHRVPPLIILPKSPQHKAKPERDPAVGASIGRTDK